MRCSPPNSSKSIPDMMIFDPALQCRPLRKIRRWCNNSVGVIFVVACITGLLWLGNNIFHTHWPQEEGTLAKPSISNTAPHSVRKIKKYVYSAPRAIGVLESVRFVDSDSSSPLKNPEFNFLIPSSSCQNRTHVLVFVHSAPGHRSDRSQIRNTWGSIQTLRGYNIRLIFILGKTGSSELQRSIETESSLFEDIVQANFVDHYRNLTYKHLTAFQWILRHCPDVPYILKMDDDAMVDIFHLIDFLESLQPNPKEFLYCSAFMNQGPRRDKLDKWFVAYEDYPDEKYPTYCEGFAYITTVDTIKTLYEVSRHTPAYWVDDVYITGILARKAGIIHTNMKDDHGYTLMTEDFDPKDLKKYLFVLAKYSHHKIHWNKIWKNIKILHHA